MRTKIAKTMNAAETFFLCNEYARTHPYFQKETNHLAQNIQTKLFIHRIRSQVTYRRTNPEAEFMNVQFR